MAPNPVRPELEPPIILSLSKEGLSCCRAGLRQAQPERGNPLTLSNPFTLSLSKGKLSQNRSRK
jgi:hypothetical protein